ncbi:MAG: LemA family protein [Candidatus Woesearchaeota archaeon]
MFILYLIIALLVIYFIFTYNSFVSLKNQVLNSFSGIDVQLKKRNDLIPNLVSTVKGYAKHEKSLLESIAKTRSSIMSSLKEKDVEKVSSQDKELSDNLKSLFAVSENYPNLKANKNFLELQREMSRIENNIAASRRIYNSNVAIFNSKLQIFPNNLFNKLLKFDEFKFYELGEK